MIPYICIKFDPPNIDNLMTPVDIGDFFDLDVVCSPRCCGIRRIIGITKDTMHVDIPHGGTQTIKGEGLIKE